MLCRNLPSLLVLLAAVAAPAGARATEADQQVSDCQTLLAAQWQALGRGDTTAADKLFGRARQEGCLEPPVAEQLCGIPAEQEALHDAAGETSLADLARSQQRLLGCEM